MRVLASVALAAVMSTASVPSSALNEPEQRARLLYQADETTQQIREKGLLYGDAELDHYLQSIVDKLYPDFAGQLEVHAIKSTAFNAFAMANGKLYVHTGALLRLRNEAELAALLGHEGAHYTGDHIYKSIQTIKMTMPIMAVLDLGLGGLASLAGASSIMGMSRNNEREADSQGFDRMVQVGYDGTKGADTWIRLLREIETLKLKQPIFFASHPAVSERIANFKAMSAKHGPGGEAFADQYLVITSPVRIAALDAILREANGKLLVLLLEKEQLLDTLPPYCRYHLAEGYRLRNDKDDKEKALVAYRETLAAAPEYAPTYAALGKRLMNDGDKAGALPLFRKYLELEPDAFDKGFIEMYVTTLEKELAQ
jgi:beta-barrel assembly-enhancing protease